MPLQQTSRRSNRPVAEAIVSSASPSANEIPFDYVSKFTLSGDRGQRIQDVINISVEGAFVAVALGYSFIPARLPPSRTPSTSTEVENLANSPNPTLNWVLNNLVQPSLDPRALVRCLAIKLCGIDFRYNIVDSGSGRELQNEPIHNIAGLGESNGDRPFRPFAKPMIFLPRSTIRIEVEEISEGPLYEGAELYIVMHGYKMLGYGTAV